MPESAALDCRSVEEQDVVSSYVAGRLAEPIAEAFERHYFECADCWDELELAYGLRGLSPQEWPRGRGNVAPLWRRRSFLALAAAASLGILALGLRTLLRERAEPLALDTPRSGAQELVVDVTRQPGGTLELSWMPQRGASRSVVEIVTPDGVVLGQHETRETRLVLQEGDLKCGAGPCRAKVRVIDSLGQEIATSGFRELTTDVHR